MNKNIKNKEERNPVKIFSMIFTSMPSLLFRLGGTYLRFKKEAQKAEKIFKRELIKQGIDKKIAEDLARIYSEGSNIKHIFHN
jgi:hypothetical protein